ncbi:MAG: serine/threonine-protein phosphatase, partial [Gammaproteobacteria bacterium]|nr:serine/threonine-protein phosphatase [Gammaproteobacteria bacterium]
HVGDSRVYLFRHARVLSRTRDHTHVELLLQEGLISEEELADHPLRSFVDNCLGGDASTPNISISKPHTLEHGDIVLACSDGIWNGLDDRDIGRFFRTKRAQDLDLKTALDSLGEAALEATTPNADNTTAVAIQWLEQN